MAINNTGYVTHNRRGKTILEHVQIVEAVIGRELPEQAVVHHWDGDKTNNINANLLVCPNEAYHRLIHRRMRAMKESGNPNFRRCHLCGKWDDPSNLIGTSANKTTPHKHCFNAYQRRRWTSLTNTERS